MHKNETNLADELSNSIGRDYPIPLPLQCTWRNLLKILF